MILVDPLTPHVTAGRKTRWCHMVSDVGEDELHAFARKLGLQRSWFQRRPAASAAHYDLMPSRRAHAVMLGAVEVTSRELVRRNYDGLTARGLLRQPPPSSPGEGPPR